eukprot:1136330-Amphidinium_carterae.1
MPRVAGRVTREPPLQSQLQGAVPQPTAAAKPTDLTTIPEGIVQATASVFSMFRRGTSAGTSPSHTPRQEQEDFVPRYQNDASNELE